MKTNSDLILREVYGKAILMPVRNNEASNDPIYLNDVAVQIWKATPNSENRNELWRAICNMYGLCENSAEAYSVEKFITQLLNDKLIFE